MTLVNLKKILNDANNNQYAVAGLVVLGWDDALAYTQAADETGIPIILQAGPSCRAHTPIPILGKNFQAYLDKQNALPMDWYTSEQVYQDMPMLLDPAGVLFDMAQDKLMDEMIMQQYED